MISTASSTARWLATGLCLAAAGIAGAGDAVVKAARGSFFSPSQTPSLGVLTVGSGATVVFDTGSGTGAPSVSGAARGAGALGRSASDKVEVALFNFDSISLADGAKVQVTGDRGLVLLSKGAVVIDTTISVAGAPGTNQESAGKIKLGGPGGPGADGGGRGKATSSAPPPANGGDGGIGRNGDNNPGYGMGAGSNVRCRGGSGGGGGGYGGAGGDSAEGSPPIFSKDGPVPQLGGGVYGDAALTDLFGGSGGAGGQNDQNFNFASGGGGGGAIGIISLASIRIGAKGRIDASGGAAGIHKARGGGGSGGGVLLAAPTVDLAAGAAIDVRGGDTGALEPDFEAAYQRESVRTPGTVAPRRDPVHSGGGGGGRVAIYSNTEFGGAGKGAEEKTIPATILLTGGPVPALVKPDATYNHPKLGKRTVAQAMAKSGASGTFFDGAWPGLR